MKKTTITREYDIEGHVTKEVILEEDIANTKPDTIQFVPYIPAYPSYPSPWWYQPTVTYAASSITTDHIIMY